jgi:hypothetical protein
MISSSESLRKPRTRARNQRQTGRDRTKQAVNKRHGNIEATSRPTERPSP